MPIIQTGTFTSTGANQTLTLRSDLDYLNVFNMTEAAATNNGHGFQYRWQRGMTQLDGIVYYHPAADHTMAISTSATLTVNGFYLFNSSGDDVAFPTYGPNVAITRIPANGVVLTATTTGLIANVSVVRFNNVLLGEQHNGMEYLVTAVNPGVSFTIVPATNNVDTGVTTGNYQIVYYPPMYYPRNLRVTNISQAANAVVTTSTAHGLTIGQKVRFHIPYVTALAYGMLQLDNVVATVLTVPTATTFTVNVNTAAFGAFAFPLTANVPFTFAQVSPLGEDTPQALSSGTNILADATYNTSSIGIVLYTGITSPAGSNGDVIFWEAGKSDNQ